MKKLLISSLILIGTNFSPLSYAEHEVIANVGITSNYIWRGVSQSDDHMSVSAGLDYSNNNGFYVGTWVGSVDYNDDTNVEFDVYGGYSYDVNDINIDLGFIYYGFQGGDNLNMSEVYAKATMYDISLGLSVLTDSQFGDDFADAKYYEISYPLNTFDEITVSLHAGYSDLSHSDNYSDFNINIEKSGFSAMISHVEGGHFDDDTVFSISYQHSFSM